MHPTVYLVILILCPVSAFLVYYTKRVRKLSKWDHFPGYSTVSNLPMLGHIYR